MAEDQVDLTPEDIPGASFIEEQIEKLTVTRLTFWLIQANSVANRSEYISKEYALRKSLKGLNYKKQKKEN